VRFRQGLGSIGLQSVVFSDIATHELTLHGLLVEEGEGTARTRTYELGGSSVCGYYANISERHRER